MSIKSKLTLGIFTIALMIVGLNTLWFYHHTKSQLQTCWMSVMNEVLTDIANAAGAAGQASGRYDKLSDDLLHAALDAAAEQLGTDYHVITSERLDQLRVRLDLSSLAVYTSDGTRVTTVLSTDRLANPSDSSKVNELYSRAVHGSGNDRFFTAGRFDFPAANRDGSLEKRGYAASTEANYVLAGALRVNDPNVYDGSANLQRIIDRLLAEKPDIRSIAVLNPDSFLTNSGSELGGSSFPYWDRPVTYGTYLYKDAAADQAAVKRVLAGEAAVSVPYRSDDGSKLTKMFFKADSSETVVLLIADNDSIARSLHSRIREHIELSVVLLAVVLAAGYSLSCLIIRPLHTILNKVNLIAVGSFGQPIAVKRRDEFGKLAAQINRMSINLENYTNRLEHTVEELRNTKEHMESFVGNTTDAIHVADMNGNVLRVNKAFEELYGHSPAQLIGTPIPIVPGMREEESEKLVRKVLQGGHVSGYETIGQTKDGSPIQVSVTVSPIRDDKGNVVACATIARNVTDRKHTEELLRRSEKLSIVGQLAAGVAHEIRNPLTTLRGFVQLQQRMGTGNPRHLELMLSELDRINLIVSEFLILAKPQATRFEVRDPRQIMNEILLLLESQANMNNIEFEKDFGDHVHDIFCESNQLKQVFINILKNAMEAMPQGGIIVIEVRNNETKQVLIRITDHGEGMSEKQLAKLGEPFYTNKENGTGLGLMVCQQIVAAHKGNMLIRSKPGNGTTVDIVLPVEH